MKSAYKLATCDHNTAFASGSSSPNPDGKSFSVEPDLGGQHTLENEDYNMVSGYQHPSYSTVHELQAFGHPFTMPYLWGGGGIYFSCLDRLHLGKNLVDQHA